MWIWSRSESSNVLINAPSHCTYLNYVAPLFRLKVSDCFGVQLFLQLSLSLYWGSVMCVVAIHWSTCHCQAMHLSSLWLQLIATRFHLYCLCLMCLKQLQIPRHHDGFVHTNIYWCLIYCYLVRPEFAVLHKNICLTCIKEKLFWHIN